MYYVIDNNRDTYGPSNGFKTKTAAMQYMLTNKAAFDKHILKVNYIVIRKYER